MSSRRDLIRERAARRRDVPGLEVAVDDTARRADLFRRLRERDERREHHQALGLNGAVAAHLEHRQAEPDCERCAAADELAAAITAAVAAG